jgi:hypothetical protein
MTPTRKEYLYQLSDISEHSHTAEYLSSVIEKVIVDVGVNRISAIVSDNASNVRKAREIIHNKFPNIENVRCIAHCINLIACDIVKHNFGDRLLRRVNNLTTFFKNSHQANSKLVQLINEKGIVGGGLKSYCKTRWTTASESVNSVVNLQQILEEIVTNNRHLLTNDNIIRIIQTRNFFSDLRILKFVLEPLRKAVLALKARAATLADCFLSLVRLAAVLNKLPRSFNSGFRNHCVKVINERFNEFDDDKYITCFFLDPRFRSAALKKSSFKRIIKCIASIGQRLGFDFHEIDILLDQLQQYKEGKDPFDLELSFVKKSPLNWWKFIATDPEPELLPKVACHLFSICPNSATCERGFSTLGWLFERRLNLKLETLESMCKLITYWKSNFKTELGYYGIDQRKNVRLSDDEINIRLAEAFNETDDDDDNDDLNSTHKSIEVPKDNCYILIEPVWIEKFVDLSHESIIKDIDVPTDILDDLDENMNDGNDGNRVGGSDEKDNDSESGKGVYDYNIDDLLSSDDDDEEE